MSYPILYGENEAEFNHNGIGILSACVSCEVTEEGNGTFELNMKYPMDGIHFHSIQNRSIIKAKSDQFRAPQLFRVISITKPMAGIVNIYARHISYDLSGIPVKPFSAGMAPGALDGLKENAVVDCPFDFWTDILTLATFDVKSPASIRSKLGGSAGSILDVYGGEFEFDNFSVRLYKQRGENRGVSVRYGKNLKDIRQEQNCANVATGIYPYWFIENEAGSALVELPEKIVKVAGEHNFEKIITVDFSQEFQVQPSEEQLRARAEKYIKDNKIDIPDVSLTISFEQLSKSEEYKNLNLLERVSLFDTVNVEFPALGVSATARAVKITYNVLKDRVENVTLGSVRANIADTIAKQQNELKNNPSKSFMQTAIQSMTKTILGAKGGSVRLIDEDGDGEPDTLYIADNSNPEKAAKVWRFNYEGWGASKNGYSGPFEMGATFENGMIADFITAGTLYGLLIKAGLIQSADGKISIDLSSNADFATFNSGISTNGLVVRADETDAKKLFSVDAYQVPEKEDEYFANVMMQSASGSEIMRITETFDAETKSPVGCSFSIQNQSGDAAVSMSTGAGASYLTVKGSGSGYASLQSRNLGSSGLGLFEGDVAVGGLVQENGESRLVTMYINGKKVEWKQNDSGDYVLTGV